MVMVSVNSFLTPFRKKRGFTLKDPGTISTQWKDPEKRPPSSLGGLFPCLLSLRLERETGNEIFVSGQIGLSPTERRDLTRPSANPCVLPMREGKSEGSVQLGPNTCVGRPCDDPCFTRPTTSSSRRWTFWTNR